MYSVQNMLPKKDDVSFEDVFTFSQAPKCLSICIDVQEKNIFKNVIHVI